MAYNINDLLGPMELDKKEYQETEEIKLPPQRVSKKRPGLKSIVKQVYSFSKLTRYLSTNVQKEQKIWGIVPPAGDFYYLTKKTYLESNENWQSTQKALKEVSQICKSNQAELILYKMPEFNLLQKPNLFSLIDEAMLNYCNSVEDIKYINGADDFRGEDGNKFKISKYDGHPNEQAHLKIAEIIKQQLSKNVVRHAKEKKVLIVTIKRKD
ncbi:hypothetical protein ACXR6G_02920 [Ancylomarina sp. YFZ004]